MKASEIEQVVNGLDAYHSYEQALVTLQDLDAARPSQHIDVRSSPDVLEAQAAYLRTEATFAEIERELLRSVVETDLDIPFKIGVIAAVQYKPKRYNLATINIPPHNSEITLADQLLGPPPGIFNQAEAIGNRMLNIQATLGRKAMTPLVVLSLGRRQRNLSYPTILETFLVLPLRGEQPGFDIEEPTICEEQVAYTLPRLHMQPAAYNPTKKRFEESRGGSATSVVDPQLDKLAHGFEASSQKLLYGNAAIERAQYEIDVVIPEQHAEAERQRAFNEWFTTARF